MDVGWVPTLLLTSYVTLGASITSLSSSFLICQMGVVMPVLTGLREKVNFIVNYLKFLGFSKCSNKTPTCMWVNWLFKKKYLFTEIFTLWWSFHYETIIWIKIIKCALFKMNVWNNRKAIIYLLNFHHFYSKSISFKLHLISQKSVIL